MSVVGHILRFIFPGFPVCEVVLVSMWGRLQSRGRVRAYTGLRDGQGGGWIPAEGLARGFSTCRRRRWSYILPSRCSLNGLRLLAPVALLGDLASALDAAPAKAAGTLLDAPREEALGAAKAFLRCVWIRYHPCFGTYRRSASVT